MCMYRVKHKPDCIGNLVSKHSYLVNVMKVPAKSDIAEIAHKNGESLIFLEVSKRYIKESMKTRGYFDSIGRRALKNSMTQ